MKQTTEHLIRLSTGTKDAWIDLDGITDVETAWEHLCEQGFPYNALVEVLDAKGFARHFFNESSRVFDLSGYIAFAEMADHISEDALEAFIEWQGIINALANLDEFSNYYVGEYEGPVDFAEEYAAGESADLIGKCKEQGLVIDWEKTAEAMLNGDFVGQEYDDHLYVFRNI